jgi:menaquinone-dependent protoporphyrinogen oxidase
MSSPRILIAYTTTFGQTAKITQRIADELAAPGDAVTVVRADNVPRDLVVGTFDVVVLGGSVLFGRHQRALVRFARLHNTALNAMPSAFFSVSGSAGIPVDSARADAQGWVTAFLRATGWAPTFATTFGGALAYTKYNPLLRFVMKRIAAQHQSPTDTSCDHELTDWIAVERFVGAVAAMACRRRTAPAMPHAEAVTP